MSKGCEQELRVDEWDSWTAQQRDADPDYTTHARGQRDMKKVTKGTIWNNEAASMLQAKTFVRRCIPRCPSSSFLTGAFHGRTF